MAKLKPCRSCGHEVSRSARTCPSCGEKNPAAKQYGFGTLFVFVLGAGVIWAVLSPGDSSSPPSSPPPSASPPVACEPVPQALIDAIADGLTVQGGGSISRAAAVKSGAHANAYYVAAVIEGPGLDGTIGVWATNRLDATGVLYSVDNMANEFSNWGDGRTTDAAFSMTDPGAAESRRCLG